MSKRIGQLVFDTARSMYWLLELKHPTGSGGTTYNTGWGFCKTITSADLAYLEHMFECELAIGSIASLQQRIEKPKTWSQKVYAWRNATFGKTNGRLSRCYGRALEEFNELQEALGLETVRTTDALYLKDPEQIADEAADYCIALSAFIGDIGYDLAERIDRKHGINSTEREWVSNGDGTGYHVNKVPR